MLSTKLKHLFFVFTILCGLALTHYAYFPGLVVNDSSVQFHQALTFKFDDLHPPIMAFIWLLTNKIVPGPEGFFLLQILLYWSGFLLIGWQLINELDLGRTGSIKYGALVLLPFSPFLFNICGTIWCDVLVFGCFAFALGLIISRPPGAGIWSWRSIVIWLLLAIGSLARHNSIVGAVPLLALHLWPEAPDRRLSRVLLGRGLAAAVLTVAVVVTSGKTVDAFVLHPQKMHMENEILLFDLLGVSHRINNNLLPGIWSADDTKQILDDCYTPMNWDPVSWWGRCHFVFDRLWQSGEWGKGLFSLWVRTVAAHPGQYLAHRFDYFHTLLWPQTTFTLQPNPESFEFGFAGNNAFRSIKHMMVFIKDHFPLYLIICDGFWIVLCSVVSVTLFLLYRIKPREYYRSLLVSLSASFYAIPLVVVGPGGDYRYVYWAAGAACIAVLLAPQKHQLVPLDVERASKRSASQNWGPAAPQM